MMVKCLTPLSEMPNQMRGDTKKEIIVNIYCCTRTVEHFLLLMKKGKKIAYDEQV